MAQGHSAKFRKVMEGWTAVVSYARWDWQHQQFQEAFMFGTETKITFSTNP